MAIGSAGVWVTTVGEPRRLGCYCCRGVDGFQVVVLVPTGLRGHLIGVDSFKRLRIFERTACTFQLSSLVPLSPLLTSHPSPSRLPARRRTARRRTARLACKPSAESKKFYVGKGARGTPAPETCKACAEVTVEAGGPGVPTRPFSHCPRCAAPQFFLEIR